MSDTRKNNLEDLITERLKDAPMPTVRLLALLQKDRPKTTKQGVYAALRLLRDDEKVVLHGGQAALSSVWLERMNAFFSTALRNYKNIDPQSGGYLGLRHGERAQYFFRDAAHLDAFWSHAFMILSETAPLAAPIYIYNPHEWFMLARQKNERGLFESVTKTGRTIRMVAGDVTPLDLYVQKFFSGARLQYRAAGRDIFKKRNYYLNVLGEYVITVTLDEAITKKIEALYRKNAGYSLAAQNEIEALARLPGRSKLTIMRNANKATRLTALLAKYFAP